MFKYIYSEESILTRIIGLFFGALIISLIIWNRLIRERLPRELTGEPFTLLFWIVLILFVCFFLRMSITVNKFQKNLRGISKPNKYLFKFYIFVKTRYESRPRVKNFCESVGGYLIHYVLEAPLFLWRYLFNNFPHKIVLFIEYDQLMRAMKTFHEIKDKYDYICTMLVSTLMTLSLMLWLLVIFGIASPSYS